MPFSSFYYLYSAFPMSSLIIAVDITKIKYFGHSDWISGIFLFFASVHLHYLSKTFPDIIKVILYYSNGCPAC